MVGRVVISSSSMTLGFVSAKYALALPTKPTPDIVFWGVEVVLVGVAMFLNSKCSNIAIFATRQKSFGV
jgi:hypothetical protein